MRACGSGGWVVTPERTSRCGGTARRFAWALMALCAGLLPVAAGCIDLPRLDDIFVRGEPFITSGTTVIVERGGPCVTWLGDNGVTYHLFQGLNVVNADFDRILVPGVRSRLVLAPRSDLEVTCRIGRTVEVQAVLEILD